MTVRTAAQVLLALVVLVAATAGGALLLAVAENGSSSLHTLVIEIAIPSAIVIGAAGAAAAMIGARRLAKGIILGLAFGALSTAGLELVRNIGFYQFNSMPGQLPELMGVLITNRIMDGPDLASNLIGWADHVWNGAAFGVTYAVIVGGFPRRRSHWIGAGMGAIYGLALGTGFLLSPVSRATGAGIFGSILGAKYVITVYLAHAVFGALLGLLVHRFASSTDPLWQTALDLLPGRSARREAERRSVATCAANRA